MVNSHFQKDTWSNNSVKLWAFLASWERIRAHVMSHSGDFEDKMTESLAGTVTQAAGKGLVWTTVGL